MNQLHFILDSGTTSGRAQLTTPNSKGQFMTSIQHSIVQKLGNYP